MRRKTRKNVGLIGLGIIGSRVAAGLRGAGFAVFVWNRTPLAEPNFLGSPAEVAQCCDVIQIFVADAQALFDVLDAVGETLTAEHLVICSATVGREATLDAAQMVRKRGARFLDAPFTGSKVAAEQRQLVYYIGGDSATFQRAKPILEASSKAIVPIGKIGDAAVVKVVTNMIAAVSVQTLAEALAIIRRSGIDPEVFAAALEQNACRSGTINLKLPKMMSGDYDPHFSLKHMFKDVQLGIHLANALGVEIPATTVTAGVMYGAMNHGWGDLDFASIFKVYEASADKLSRLSATGELPDRARDRPAPPAAELSGALPPPSSEFLEVVTSLPKDTKRAAKAHIQANDANPEKPPAANCTAGPEEQRFSKPFNRIRRFFTATGQ